MLSVKREHKHINIPKSIRRINFGCILRNSNISEYGVIVANQIPGTPHKGQPVLRALVVEHIFPLINKESVVLDLGCRNLDLAVFLGERVGKVVNVDISPETVAWAMYYGYYAICASAEDLPVEPNSIDIYHASHVFEHVPDLARSLYEALRVLRQSGHLFVRVPLASYYRHHRYYIGTLEAMIAEIQKQCPCEILHASVGNGLGSPEAIVLAQKVGEPTFLPQKYKHDLVGTVRGLVWRVRHRFS